jgi:hypothetical protein
MALAKARSANLIYSKYEAIFVLEDLLMRVNPEEAMSLLEETGRIEFPKYISPGILSKFIGKT